MSATKQAPRRLSEEERYKRLETRVVNRVKAWDAKAAEPRRHEVVEHLRDAIDMLEAREELQEAIDRSAAIWSDPYGRKPRPQLTLIRGGKAGDDA